MPRRPGIAAFDQARLHSTNAIAAAMEAKRELDEMRKEQNLVDIRAKRAEVRLNELRAHLRRFNRALDELDPNPPPTVGALRREAA